jgi:ribonucleoside-diphosphate reductase alpha chain
MIKIVNNTVPTALFKLGYNNAQVDAIVSYIDATGTIEGAPSLKPEHLAVFDCSFKPSKGTRSIHYMGHVRMMAATQPFLSGAISKTVNLPHDCTLDDIAEAYLESWRLGLKAVAVYRDGSKGAQPLNVSDGAKAKDIKGTSPEHSAAADRVLAALSSGHTPADSDIKTLEAKLADKVEIASKSILGTVTAFNAALASLAVSEGERSDSPAAEAPPRAVRHRLPDERASLTHKFGIAGHEGYITVGLYPNGQPGEIFIRMAKEGSTVSGLMDSFATAASIALQHGVPLKLLCEKFAHSRFEPSGWTGNEHIGYAKSIMDYIFRWLQLRFLSGQQLSLFANLAPAASAPVLSGDEGDAKDLRLSSSEQGGPMSPEQHTSTRGMGAHGAPHEGIAPESGSLPPAGYRLPAGSLEDRGLYHAADAMRSMYDMGDAPSCHTCGAIMVRNGSCYRCMSCGSTSGCS